MAEIVCGRYRHFKGGVYIVIGTATHSETGEELVIYHKVGSGLVVTDEEQKLWARPVKMWNETVYRHGSEKPRFELLNTIPAADVVAVVMCKDCVHRPEASDGVTSGVRVEAPRDEEGWHDDTCPYLCGDPWYNEMPNDDWFCHLGERKGNG